MRENSSCVLYGRLYNKTLIGPWIFVGKFVRTLYWIHLEPFRFQLRHIYFYRIVAAVNADLNMLIKANLYSLIRFHFTITIIQSSRLAAIRRPRPIEEREKKERDKSKDLNWKDRNRIKFSHLDKKRALSNTMYTFTGWILFPVCQQQTPEICPQWKPSSSLRAYHIQVCEPLHKRDPFLGFLV